MSATIRRDHIVNLVIGDRRPFAVHFDFVVVADHAALGRAAVHEVTASALAVISVQLEVKLHMPPIVTDPVISFLRPRGDTQEYGNHADYRHPPRRNHKNFPQWDGRFGRASNGLSRASMISHVGMSPGVPAGRLQQKLYALSRAVAGACVAARRDLT